MKYYSIAVVPGHRNAVTLVEHQDEDALDVALGDAYESLKKWSDSYAVLSAEVEGDEIKSCVEMYQHKQRKTSDDSCWWCGFVCLGLVIAIAFGGMLIGEKLWSPWDGSMRERREAAYDQGRRAYRAGIEVKDCPWSTIGSSEQYMQWRLGWGDENDESKERLPKENKR